MINNQFGNAGYTTENINQGYNRDYFDPESQEVFEDDKSSLQIRHGFIRKVYGILATQLVLTSICGAYFTLDATARLWILTNTWFFIGCAVASLVLILVLICAPGATQSVPLNYILLFAFTACEAVGIGGACASAATTSGGIVVLQALTATAVITVGLTLFAFQTKYDFVSWMGCLFYILLGCMILSIFTIFFKSKLLHGAICAIIALVFCAYIVVDTQVLIGKGKIRASEDDYILCALTLYLDILNLFLYLLRLLQIINSSSSSSN